MWDTTYTGQFPGTFEATATTWSEKVSLRSIRTPTMVIDESFLVDNHLSFLHLLETLGSHILRFYTVN